MDFCSLHSSVSTFEYSIAFSQYCASNVPGFYYASIKKLIALLLLVKDIPVKL